MKTIESKESVEKPIKIVENSIDWMAIKFVKCVFASFGRMTQIPCVQIPNKPKMSPKQIQKMQLLSLFSIDCQTTELFIEMRW